MKEIDINVLAQLLQNARTPAISEVRLNFWMKAYGRDRPFVDAPLDNETQDLIDAPTEFENNENL